MFVEEIVISNCSCVKVCKSEFWCSINMLAMIAELLTSTTPVVRRMGYLPDHVE
jgi:hypothetical protein